MEARNLHPSGTERTEGSGRCVFLSFIPSRWCLDRWKQTLGFDALIDWRSDGGSVAAVSSSLPFLCFNHIVSPAAKTAVTKIFSSNTVLIRFYLPYLCNRLDLHYSRRSVRSTQLYYVPIYNLEFILTLDCFLKKPIWPLAHQMEQVSQSAHVRPGVFF